MKTIIALFMASFITLSGIAQTTNKVTLIFRGINKTTSNYQVSIDGNSYYSNTSTKNVANTRITVNNVPVGMHTLKTYKLKNNNAAYNGKTQNTLIYTKNFEVREGFDMNIVVMANGRVQFSEVEIPTAATSSPTTAMAATQFDALLQNVKSQWSQSMKGQAIQAAFSNTANYFSTAQIRQLLTLVTSESDRLDLAKLAYRGVTDAANFSQLSTLFNSSSYRNEFSSYVSSMAGQTSTTVSGPLTDYQFSELIKTISNKRTQALRTDAIHSYIAASNASYSTAQVHQMLNLITSESDRLDLAKLSYRTISDANNFYQLADLFNSTSYRNEFNNYVNSNGGSQATNTGKVQITDYQFSQLMQNVNNQWSQSLKAQAVRDAFANTNNYFSTSQIRQLLVTITAESDRLQLAKLSYRGVTDAANFGSLADLFSISSNRTEFNNYVYAQGGTTGTSATAKTAMASGDFEILVLGIRSNLIQPLKVNAVANTFNNPNYYFTSSQVRSLISLINSETSRLDLAKLAYRTVTDRSNFTQVYDLFSTQSNKDSLADYVKNYQGQ